MGNHAVSPFILLQVVGHDFHGLARVHGAVEAIAGQNEVVFSVPSRTVEAESASPQMYGLCSASPAGIRKQVILVSLAGQNVYGQL